MSDATIDLVVYLGVGLLTSVLTVLGGHVATENRYYIRWFYFLGVALSGLIVITGIRGYQATLRANAASEDLTHLVSGQKTDLEAQSKAIEGIKESLGPLRPVAKESVSRCDLVPGYEPFVPDKPYKVIVSVRNGGGETGNASAAFATLVQADSNSHAQQIEFARFIKSLAGKNLGGRDLGPDQDYAVQPDKPIVLTKSDWDDVKTGKRPIYTLVVARYRDWRGDRVSTSCISQWGELKGGANGINDLTHYCQDPRLSLVDQPGRAVPAYKPN